MQACRPYSGPSSPETADVEIRPVAFLVREEFGRSEYDLPADIRPPRSLRKERQREVVDEALLRRW
jgi:hypothetical protein